MKKTYFATVPLAGSLQVSWTEEEMTEDKAVDRAVELTCRAGYRLKIDDVDPDPEVAGLGLELELGEEFDSSVRHHNHGNVCRLPVPEARLDYVEDPDE